MELAGVVTAPPRPSGRHGRPAATPVDLAATELGARTVLRPARLRAPASLAAVAALDPALAVLADYGQIVPPPLLDLRHGALNLHPSLLPRHRGASPIPATILAGDRETGVTLMRMDAGLDTGPIVAVERLPLGGRERAPDLEAELAARAAGLLRRSLGPWLRGELAARPQPAEAASLTRPLRREDGRLDPTRGAAQLERAVRAYAPWPGTFVETEAGRIAVLAAEVAPSRAGDEPGVLTADEAGLALTTSDGRLRLLEVRPAGGRPMRGDELVRGRRGLPGTRVVVSGGTRKVESTAPR